jgi:hypothetical protein
LASGILLASGIFCWPSDPFPDLLIKVIRSWLQVRWCSSNLYGLIAQLYRISNPNLPTQALLQWALC